MKTFLMVLGLINLVVAPHLSAQWRDTTFTDSAVNGKILAVTNPALNDSVFASKHNKFVHPKIAFICSSNEDRLATVIWTGVPPVARDSTLVSVIYQIDTLPPVREVWAGSVAGRVLYPSQLWAKTFFHLLATAKKFSFEYATPDGTTKLLTFNVDGLYSELGKFTEVCPKVKLYGIV